MNLWSYELGSEKKFLDYHYSSINDKEFTFSQIYHTIDKRTEYKDENDGYSIELESLNDEDLFAKVLNSRRSYADSLMTDVKIEEQLISEFCHLAFLGKKKTFRNYPSGGGLYNLNIFLIFNPKRVDRKLISNGNIGYLNAELKKIICYDRKNWENEVREGFIQKYLFDSAQFAIILASNMEEVSTKYSDISYKLLQQEAGHIGQNIQLVATYLNLKTAPLQGYYDLKLANLVGIDQTVLYSFLVG